MAAVEVHPGEREGPKTRNSSWRIPELHLLTPDPIAGLLIGGLEALDEAEALGITHVVVSGCHGRRPAAGCACSISPPGLIPSICRPCSTLPMPLTNLRQPPS